VYPEIPEDGIVSELWHAQKWCKTMSSSHLSPMYSAGRGRHFYVNELCRLKSGQLVIPVRWVTHKDKVLADAYFVSCRDDVSNFASV
jgi:hypothetical protein